MSYSHNFFYWGVRTRLDSTHSQVNPSSIHWSTISICQCLRCAISSWTCDLRFSCVCWMCSYLKHRNEPPITLLHHHQKFKITCPTLTRWCVCHMWPELDPLKRQHHQQVSPDTCCRHQLSKSSRRHSPEAGSPEEGMLRRKCKTLYIQPAHTFLPMPMPM